MRRRRERSRAVTIRIGCAGCICDELWPIHFWLRCIEMQTTTREMIRALSINSHLPPSVHPILHRLMADSVSLGVGRASLLCLHLHQTGFLS